MTTETLTLLTNCDEIMRAMGSTMQHEADLIREREWADVNWEYLERKLPMEVVDELYSVAMEEDALKF